MLRAPFRAGTNSATLLTNATMIKPMNAGVMRKASPAACTDSTKISLDIAMSTVATASVTRDRRIGHAPSEVCTCATLPKSSGCVFSEKTMLKP